MSLRIAVIGPGAIGSTFAFQLSRAGHEVTVVARGTRLQQLRRDRAIITTDGQRAPVRVAGELDTAFPWDLVLVTVLAYEADVLLPALAGCAARGVMFMFNTFQPLDRLRDVVGTGRTAFGFPAVGASLDDGGRLSSLIPRRGASTTVSDARWADVFSAAGVPSATRPDMQGWLRTHAALVVPIVLAAHSARRSGRGVSWHEAATLARALGEGLRLVRRLGNRITPGPVAILGRLPVPLLAGTLWTLTRLPAFVAAVSVAPEDEPAALIDEMISCAPHETPALTVTRALPGRAGSRRSGCRRGGRPPASVPPG